MKTLALLLSVLLLLVCALPIAAQAESPQPEIVLTYAPAYNVNDLFRGYVRGIDDPSQYRVTLFLQVLPGQQYWVKPTDAQPSVELSATGEFLLDYTSGGQDLQAQTLHLLLIPADYRPSTHGLADARSVALDEVTVTRTDAGDVTVSPNRKSVGKSVACGPAAGKLLVDVGFYTNGGGPGQGLDTSLVTAQLDALGSFVSGVRLYAASGELYPAYQMARGRGLFVFGTAYLCGNSSADRAEMDALIEHCNSGRAQVAIVGNETLLSRKLTEEQLLDCIAYVRAGITDPSIPVTTSDSVGFFIDHPLLIDACDIVMPNIYPYWEGCYDYLAAGSFISTVSTLQRIAGPKPVVVSETGWPTYGERVGHADPGGPAAADYFEAVWAWSVGTGTPILWFEGADEPWKAGDEGVVGAHWGFLTNELLLKADYAQLGFFQSAAAGIMPVLVTPDPNGGEGTMHALATGRDHLLTLPECAYTAPEGMRFLGWLVGSRLYYPGDVCLFEAPATISAFWLPADVDTVTLPADLISVNDQAFEHSGVRFVVVPDICTAIGPRAFADCEELLAVVLTENITSIARDACDESGQVLILAPEGSAAANWAAANGFRWGLPEADGA